MKRALAVAALVAILACVVPAASAYGDDWTQFRGPNRDGKSAETGLLKSWPEGGPKLLWTAKGCGAGYGSATVVGNAIYIIGDVSGNESLIAFSADGKAVGQKPFGAANTKDPRGINGGRSTPTFDGGMLYVGGAMGELACFDAKTLEKVWEVNVKDEFKGVMPKWEYAESPLVDGDNVICAPGGPDATIVALNKKTGKTVWTSKGLNDPAGYGSCVKMTLDNVPMIVAMTEKNLVGVNAKTGQYLWHNKAMKPAANCPSPVFFGNRIFEANGYGAGGMAVDLKVSDAGVAATQVWDTKDMDCHHGGYVLVDGNIYGNNLTGWSCIDFKTGQTKWKDPGVGKGSIIYADGMLYTQCEAGGDSKDGKTKGRQIGLVKASPDAFTMVSKFQLPTGGQGFLWAHPAIANGRLFIRHGDVLYCYDIKGAGGEAKKPAEKAAK